MKCKFCNSDLKEEDKFCRNCGAPVEKVKKGRKKKEEEKAEVKEEPIQNVPPVAPVQKTESNGLAVASIVIGALSFVFGWIIWILPVVGLILGICCKKKCTEKTVGIILNSIACFLVTIIVIMFILIGLFVRTVVSNVSDSDLNEHIFDENLYSEILRDNEASLNWKTYRSLRNDAVGYNLDINGTFRILDVTSEGWNFNNGEFYWYKDVNNTANDYWYGKANIVTGKTGLSTLGISESKISELVRNGNVKDENIYAMELTPLKIVSGGVDKSSTNIPSNTKWVYVWVLVDHGSEGIEAKVLNNDTSKVSYFVKMAD